MLRIACTLLILLPVACVVSDGSSEQSTSVADGGTAGGELECGDPGSESHLEGTECFCNAGFDWCDPNDLNDFSCCPIGGGECTDPNSHQEGSQCFCDDGFDWCDPNDPNDLSCCSVTGTSSGGGSTGDTGDTSGTSSGGSSDGGSSSGGGSSSSSSGSSGG